MNNIKTGWICPKCNQGISPDITTCPCHMNSLREQYEHDLYIFNKQQEIKDKDAS